MLGKRDGVSVGEIDGVEDGLAVGKGDGAGEGGLVGEAVGMAVTVGETVGPSVGDKVGDFVGEDVGQPLQVSSHAAEMATPSYIWPHHSEIRIVVLLSLAVNHAQVRVVSMLLYG